MVVWIIRILRACAFVNVAHTERFGCALITVDGAIAQYNADSVSQLAKILNAYTVRAARLHAKQIVALTRYQELTFNMVVVPDIQVIAAKQWENLRPGEFVFGMLVINHAAINENAKILYNCRAETAAKQTKIKRLRTHVKIARSIDVGYDRQSIVSTILKSLPHCEQYSRKRDDARHNLARPSPFALSTATHICFVADVRIPRIWLNTTVFTREKHVLDMRKAVNPRKDSSRWLPGRRHCATLATVLKPI